MSDPAEPVVDTGPSSFAQKMARLKACENLAGLEKSLLSVFEAALLPSGPTDEGRRTPEAAAAQIDQLCPSLEAPETLELFIWTLWELSLTVVRAAPYDDPALERMVAILESLRLRARGTVSLWGVWFLLSILNTRSKLTVG